MDFVRERRRGEQPLFEEDAIPEDLEEEYGWEDETAEEAEEEEEDQAAEREGEEEAREGVERQAEEEYDEEGDDW